MTTQEAALIRILAQTDAVFVPVRDTQSYRNRTAYEARTRYSKKGIAYHGGGSAAERQAAVRGLVSLRAAKLVETYVGPAGRTTNVKLTDKGDAFARELARLTDLSWAIDHLILLRLLELDAGKTEWIPETYFTRGIGWGDGKQIELARVEHSLLPALVRGWIQHGATFGRCVVYRLTDAGRAAADANIDDFADGNYRFMAAIGKLPKPTKGGREYYFEQLNEALRALDVASLECMMEIGPCAIREGAWRQPKPTDADNLDALLKGIVTTLLSAANGAAAVAEPTPQKLLTDGSTPPA